MDIDKNDMYSMTGFGRSSLHTEEGIFQIEIFSVNKRFLEIKIYLPKNFFDVEIDIRKKISNKIFRGSVFCKVFFFPNDDIIFNENILSSLKKRYEDLSEKLGFEKEKITLAFLLEQMKDIPIRRDIKKENKNILQALEKAIDELVLSRKKEGNILKKDIKNRIGLIGSFLIEIEKKKDRAIYKLENRLKEKLKNFISVKDDKIASEIVVFADKLDITEEIIRAKSHLKQLYDLLNISRSGRKLDFFIQEILREVNTMSAKVLDSDVSCIIVNIKSELEKIKEQVQNVE